MKLEELHKAVGDWVGTGTMNVGHHSGPTFERLTIEPTDFPDSFSYIRKSRIAFPGRDLLHHEIGYLKVDSASIMLSRGTYVILDWNEKTKQYEYNTSSDGTRDVVRTITFQDDTIMMWDSTMEVLQRGEWQRHLACTEFRLVAKNLTIG